MAWSIQSAKSVYLDCDSVVTANARGQGRQRDATACNHSPELSWAGQVPGCCCQYSLWPSLEVYGRNLQRAAASGPRQSRRSWRAWPDLHLTAGFYHP